MQVKRMLDGHKGVNYDISNKKEIVDFLWDWADTSDWAKLLVHKIVSTESNLSTTDREEVFQYFLQAVGLKKGLPTLTTAKPSYSPTSKKIKLYTLLVLINWQKHRQ